MSPTDTTQTTTARAKWETEIYFPNLTEALRAIPELYALGFEIEILTWTRNFRVSLTMPRVVAPVYQLPPGGSRDHGFSRRHGLAICERGGASAAARLLGLAQVEGRRVHRTIPVP
jgi:hypothetical protein